MRLIITILFCTLIVFVVPAQTPLKFLHASQLDLLQKFGNPHWDDMVEVLPGIRVHECLYHNLPEKGAETRFRFNRRGEVVKISIQWSANSQKCLSLWNKYSKQFKKEYQISSEYPDTLAEYTYVKKTEYFELVGDLEISRSDTDFIIKLAERRY